LAARDAPSEQMNSEHYEFYLILCFATTSILTKNRMVLDKRIYTTIQCTFTKCVNLLCGYLKILNKNTDIEYFCDI